VTTVEDIERQQRLRRFLFRGVMLLLLALLCIFIGWVISRIGYTELHSDALRSYPPTMHRAHADLLLSRTGSV
jgi:hypothetical protein